jgi:hypothetical protein
MFSKNYAIPPNKKIRIPEKTLKKIPGFLIFFLHRKVRYYFKSVVCSFLPPLPAVMMKHPPPPPDPEEPWLGDTVTAQ